MEIPYQKLSSDALKRLIEHFVLQEGTDYGSREYSLEEKVEQVRRQIERGEAKIVFNPGDGGCGIVPAKTSS